MYLSYMLNSILMILLFTGIYSQQKNCNYDKGNITEFLNDTNRQEKCFSLSYSFGNGQCCYLKSKNLCIDNSTPDNNNSNIPDENIPSETITTTDGVSDNTLLRNAEENDLICPNISKLNVPNNCGMAGLYEPKQNTTCNGISLVQGYCCFVRMHKDNEATTACIRTKQLNKDIKKASDQIVAYVKESGLDGITIDSVECGQNNLKLFWILNFIFYIIYIF